MKDEILIVEDDPAQAEIFVTAVKVSGLPVTHLNNGAQVLEYILEHAPRLIVLDLHLPDLNGDKLLQAIRQNAQTAAAKVILATADPRLAEALQEQADLTLLKPVSYLQLKDLTQRLLK